MSNKNLRDVYESYFIMGAAVTPKLLREQGSFIRTYFASITAENEMKFEALQPSRGKYDFKVADEMVDFAMNNNIKMRGHTLVWHQQTPNWVFESTNGGNATREELLSNMESHIKEVVGRYKGKIYCWDVANEIIDDKDDYIRKSKWLDIIGEDYIEKAFRYAHEADKEAILFYNDYNATEPTKSDKIFRLVKNLLDREVPVHGIGLQGHWNIYGPSIDQIKAAIELYASLGVTLQLTELDISMYNNEDNLGLLVPTEEMLELQAKRYKEIFSLFREYKEYISGVTFWGVADNYTWLDNFPVKNRKNWPFIFDINYQPKESYKKIINI